MDEGMPNRKAHIGEGFGLGIAYLLLTGLFFAASHIVSGASLGNNGAQGFVGHSGLVETVSGCLSFLAMSLAVWYLRAEKMIYNIVICFMIAAIASVADFFLTMAVYKVFYAQDGLNFAIADNIKDLFMCWAAYFGWSSVFLTLLYSFDVRDRERRLAVARENALSAQMRALRYQVNPHFLFNTLNSIAGLIEEGSATRAERMVLSLSTFLRTTLSLDPFHDVPLSEELSLQEEYLEIERERFLDRMSFRIDMPDEVRQALVPSLILQPVIENAIKHGVGAMAGKVSISLSARREAGRLLVSVENDMPLEQTAQKPAGMGVGLKNVAERLRTRFQEEGRFSAGIAAPGLYRATLDMPWRIA